MLIILLIALVASACGGGTENAPPASPPPAEMSQVDLVAGSGAEAKQGTQLTVHYTGWLYDASAPENKGRQFDSSVGREPFTFRLGGGQVIEGWDRGFEGMRVRGKRRLIIPPSLGYGESGAGGGLIPGNAGLVFEMELLDVR